MIDWNSNQTRLAFEEIRSYVEMYGRGSRVVRLAYDLLLLQRQPDVATDA